MMRRPIAALLVAVAVPVAFAQNAPAPEQCLVTRAGAPALEVTHGGRTYRMADEACRAQFVSDPERYSQLYDALLELEAGGTPLRAPATPSLVPS